MDGLELLAAVRAEHPDLPFIPFTGAGSEGIASEAITAGVTEYLRKRTSPEQNEILTHRSEQAVERARTERQLRRERELRTSAVDALQDIFYVRDTDGYLQRWNDRVNEVSGYADEEIESMHVTEFFVDDATPQLLEAIDEVIETGDATLRAPVETKSSEQPVYEFRGSRLIDDDGSVRGACGIAREVGGDGDPLVAEGAPDRWNARNVAESEEG